MIRISASVAADALSEGSSTVEQPEASAPPSFQAAMLYGKLYGVSAATTPWGS